MTACISAVIQCFYTNAKFSDTIAGETFRNFGSESLFHASFSEFRGSPPPRCHISTLWSQTSGTDVDSSRSDVMYDFL